ncbi:5-methyltetrahydropteroyltriglutamate--homocysteine S-methyltransferase [uncultured Cytophaga sp.]|uniref:5-methyltetrahydropteroyltriglutamate-- homocysteine S-methyltransferase n=1 Tax=uncultured Cytophaga sp. TaxID=160238 RepID=UPI0026326502|nr:5-methyltetrahydropteroyltriglutamate--homocysteine S-methyltransferase [uncultured Cytophaga sp.]
MIAHNLGYPRIGNNRELKKASEQYWAGTITQQKLQDTAKAIRTNNWLTQKEAGLDLIPCNDFSFYDQVLDMSFMFGLIPDRFSPLLQKKDLTELDIYFAMARGYQKDGYDITAMEMTKWFDTNYHYIVPEFKKNQKFSAISDKAVREYTEAKALLGKAAKPVLLGPVSYLLAGKEKESGFNRIELLDQLLPVYFELVKSLESSGAEWIQLDEPFLVMDLSAQERKAYETTYTALSNLFPSLKFIVATYFECTGTNIDLASKLPVHALHLDLVRCPSQLTDILTPAFIASKTLLSLGLVDGRNVWRNDYAKSNTFITKAISAIGKDRILIAPSCSLLHVPCDLENESNTQVLTPEIKNWMAFAKQKLHEVGALKKLNTAALQSEELELLRVNTAAIENRITSKLIHKQHVKERVKAVQPKDSKRLNTFATRQQIQEKALKLPLMPTTTIGSFPQTDEVRANRAKYKKGDISITQYEDFVKTEMTKAIEWQEKIGIDVLVHGEFERNDMVEYFGEQLEGYVFSENGWVQSYGSRCVKPPIIYGDIERAHPMTVTWTALAQSLTKKYMKGMLTGPVTILQWSFVRDDQPRKDTCMQLALAIRDEVVDLETAGIKIIQIDEPAIREGLPLRRENWEAYLNWAVECFRVSASGVKDETQIHTHMCYSEFNDIIKNIADMDADVITIETSRSQMELLEAFVDFNYPNEIGPGVYDIHSPRIPSTDEMIDLLNKAMNVLPVRNIWVNPDCGLKTRRWPETEAALINMVAAAQHIRKEITAVV